MKDVKTTATTDALDTSDVVDVIVSGDAEAKPKTLEEAIAAGVEQWATDHLRNTSFSRDVDAWNILQAALPNLPGAIMKEVN